MSEATIPKPTNEDYSLALTSLLDSARCHKLDTKDVSIRLFLVHHAEVIAQLEAEVRWLRNMIHPK